MSERTNRGTQMAVMKRLEKKKDTIVEKMDEGEVEVSKLQDNPYQPRLNYDEQELNDLAQSIKENRLLQPIVVTQRANGDFIIVAGHRRKRAFELLKKEKIPATILKDLSDMDLMAYAAVENLLRTNLTLLETAKVYYDLSKHGFSNRELSRRLSVNESKISRTKQLLNLSEFILEDLRVNDSTRDILALSELRKVKNEELQTKLYFDFLKNDRDWLMSEIKKLDFKAPIHSLNPLVIKKDKMILNLKELDKDKIKMIEDYINNILKTSPHF